MDANVEITNINRLCRTCTLETNDSDLQTIFGDSTDEMLSRLAGVEVSKDDRLPCHVCKQCKFKLNFAYAFKIQCQRSDFELREIVRRNDMVITSRGDCDVKDTQIIPFVDFKVFDDKVLKTEPEDHDIEDPNQTAEYNTDVDSRVYEEVTKREPENSDLEVSNRRQRNSKLLSRINKK